MARKTENRSRSPQLAAEMMLLSPWVAGSRLSSMGRRKSHSAVRNDLGRLAQEKSLAFAQSGFAFAMAIAKANMDLVVHAGSWLWAPWLRTSGSDLLTAYRQISDNVLSAGLEPLHARVVTNAKRLRRG
jgi:hypothetical protein